MACAGREEKMFRRLRLVLLAAVFAASVFAQAQKPLTNEDVIQLAKSGLGEEIILRAVATNQPAFDTSVQGLTALKSAGVSDKVIAAVLDRQAQAASNSQPREPARNMPPPPASTPSGGNLEAGPPTDPGVYYQDQGSWIRLEKAKPRMETKGLIKANVNPFSKASYRYMFSGAAAHVQVSEAKPVFYFRKADLSPRS